MSDRLAELERLQRLRDQGTLDEAEFAAEKARLLAARHLPWWPLALVAAMGLVGWLMGSRLIAPQPTPTVAARPMPKPSPSVSVVAADRSRAAELAAFPEGRALESESGSRVVFGPGVLVEAPFGPVLVSEGRVADAAHADTGYVAVHYLRAAGDGLEVARAFPEAVKSGSFGQMSEMAVSRKFGDLPVIYTQGGGNWQGYTCGWTTLAELRPEGPVELVSFMDTYADGTSEDGESSEGKIADIVPGRSFTVRFTGSRSFVATYVRRGNRYVLEGGDANALQGC